MTLATGSKLGPYEIVGQIGAGGMGEVYRAQDPRLGRDVAIKVLPASFSQDTDRLRRFEQEAKAAGLLNHPNITAVYDVGSHDGSPYVVQELLDGETLRETLAGGRLAPRRVIEYALQIANGLAAAHEKGIVHRDLKPENVFVTADGRVKILDFGLAKLTQQEKETPATDLPTATAGTEPGVVLGTLGYMSPEQVRGKPADARSDIFSFGSILYEALSGRRAFTGDSAADTMSAILREDPPELSVTNQSISPALERIVRHCLEKSPERRFHSAHDLAFDLETLSSGSGIAAPGAPRVARRRLRWPAIGSVLGAIAIGAVCYFAGRRAAAKPPLSFQQLTFRRGVITAARFGPDSQNFVYSARWEGAPPRIFTGRTGSAESTPLAIPNASLAGVSARGELLAQLDATPLRGFTHAGMLARVPLAGGSPRQLLENVQWADWAPDSMRYAVVRDAAGKVQLEFPAGRPVFSTAGFITHPRVSPRGDMVAFVEHPLQGDDGGLVSVVDLGGRKRSLTQSFATAWGLAWDPDGSRILFTAAKVGGNRALRAVDLRGGEKLVAEVAGTLTLNDVGVGGRALVARDDARAGMLGMATGESVERDLSWLDWTFVRDMSADGRTVLFDETGQGGGPGYSIYMRGIDGSPAVRLGAGTGSSLSRDGKWVIAVPPLPAPQQLVALPTGPGESRPLTHDAINHHAAAWLPDGRGFVSLGDEPGHGNRLYVQEVGGAARPISPEGMEYFYIPVSPDGRWAAGRGHDRQIRLYSTQGAASRPVPGVEPGDIPLRFTEDGRELYVLGRQLPADVFRVDLASGRREMWRELMPADAAGIASIFAVLPAADGRAYVYSYARTLSQLYLVEGLK